MWIVEVWTQNCQSEGIFVEICVEIDVFPYQTYTFSVLKYLQYFD